MEPATPDAGYQNEQAGLTVTLDRAVGPELARLNQAAAQLSALNEELATAGAGRST